MGRNTLVKNTPEMRRGVKAEANFELVAEQRGYTVELTPRSVDILDHIDMILTKDDESFSVDVKSRKKISRYSDEYDDEKVWVEFQNVRGKPGWLYGKADRIVFERADDFVLVDRESLKEYCECAVAPLLVNKPYEAMYKAYQRPNRKDMISLILMKDILHPYSFTEEVEIWKKEVDKAA